jgi:hypothetical protein
MRSLTRGLWHRVLTHAAHFILCFSCSCHVESSRDFFGWSDFVVRVSDRRKAGYDYDGGHEEGSASTMGVRGFRREIACVEAQAQLLRVSDLQIVLGGTAALRVHSGAEGGTLFFLF